MNRINNKLGKYTDTNNITLNFLHTVFLLFVMFTLLLSCNNITPTESLTKIIESTENRLYNVNSFDELVQLQDSMLVEMTSCLDKNHNGYRFQEGDEEYNQIIKRLDRYNVIYCRSLSRYNSEFNTEKGDKGKITQVLALMRTMESRAITQPEGFKPDGKEESAISVPNSILPTKDEILSVNKKLPVLVSDGMMLTKVEYDEKTKVLSYYYDYTRDVDENAMTPDYKEQVKLKMIDAFVGTQNEDRLKAGMTILYIYRSIDKEKLYDICITADDLK